MTAHEIALCVMVGIYAQESSSGRDARAWRPGRHAAGPLQITRICADDYNRRHPAHPVKWPDDFLADRTDPITNPRGISRIVYLDHIDHYAPHIRTGGPNAREIALVWRYGLDHCRRTLFSDPEGYWEKVVEKGGLDLVLDIP